MTIYDDAELAAIAIVREALAEDEGEARSRAMHDRLCAMAERHESGPTAVVVALARLAANMTSAVAGHQGTDPRELLDRFEMHKLEQQQDDGDGDEP